MYCRECGHEIREDSKFCMKCGTKVVLDMGNKSMVSTINNANANTTINSNSTYTTNDANNNVMQSEKVSQKSWYEEIGAIKSDVNKYIGNSGNESNIYLFMTIALIWLALSCFMPLADVLYGEYSFFGISNALNDLADWGVKVGFYIIITFLCKISYIIGIVLLICYILKLMKLEKIN